MPKIKRIICILLAILLLTGAAFAAYRMLSMAHEYESGKQAYIELQQAVIAPTPTPPAPKAQPMPEAEPTAAPEEEIDCPSIDFAALKKINPDTVGWVYIAGTNINYPVVRGEDNRHYVSTLFDGRYNKAGSIFMDYRNDPALGDPHTVLYGHNMRNKTMFADILNYRDQAYYDAHPTGIYLTAEKRYRFEIAAAHVASLADPAWQLEFATDEAVEAWLREAMEDSAFASRAVYGKGDRLITLSTCSYEFDEARFVLVGILREF